MWPAPSEQQRRVGQPVAHAPGPGRNQHGWAAGAAPRELPRPAGRMTAQVLVADRGEGRGHDRAAHLCRASGRGAYSCRGGFGQAQMQVVAGVQPLSVHGEVGDHDRAGRADTAPGPQPPRDLSSLVEGGDERVRSPAFHNFAQAWLQDCGQRPGARRPVVPVARVSAVAEECRVDRSVSPWAAAQRRAVDGAQPAPGAGGQQVEEVHACRQVAAGPQTPGQFGGDSIVSGAHARADDQNPTSHSWIFLRMDTPRMARRCATPGRAGR